MRIAPLAALAAPLLFLAACDAAAPSVDADTLAGDAVLEVEARHARGGHVGLAAVRRATARYHQVDRAVAAGWGAIARSECVEHPVLGGMGYHYVHLDLLDDGGALDPAAPEALLYEPQKNGRLRLVAVEYIVLAPEDAEPPTLFGEAFHWNPVLEFWALHAWVWEHNPAGMFADFNPRVSCDHAADEG